MKMKFTWMICKPFTIMRQFFHKVSFISNMLLPTLIKTLYISAVKFPASTHYENFVSIRCHLQNGIQVVHSLKGQRRGSGRVPDLGCEQKGEEESIPFFFCDYLAGAQAGVRPSIFVKEKDVFHVSVRKSSTDELSQFVRNFLVPLYYGSPQRAAHKQDFLFSPQHRCHNRTYRKLSFFSQ
jgi:hypothetical protein